MQKMSRLRFSLVTTLLLALASSATAAQKLHHTTDEGFIRRQEFVYQLLWRPEDLGGRFSDIVERAGSLEDEDLRRLTTDQDAADKFIRLHRSDDLLPKNLSATAYNAEHLAEIRVGFALLLGARDFDTFALLSLYTRRLQNQILWFFEFALASMQRRDTRRCRFPNFHEALPNYAFNDDVLDRVNDECGAVIAGEYSAVVSRPTGDDPEARLAYFTEDVGLGDFYFFLVGADHPFWLSSESRRRGERYFNDHRQLLARYELERLANGLGEVEEVEFDGGIATGYYPRMRDYNGVPFPVRPMEAEIPDDKKRDARLGRLFESRLAAAADRGQLQTRHGELSDSEDPDAFFNSLMNSVQGNGDSVDLGRYGSLDTLARHILGFSPEPRSKRDVVISAMENLNADVRDPGFYRMYKKIVRLGLRYRYSRLPAYGRRHLDFPGVALESVEVDEVTTYFDGFDSLLDQQQCGDTLVRQRRLNHEDFSVRLTVKSELNSAKAVVRLFLGPKHDANGRAVDIGEARNNFFQLDQFVVKLKRGTNHIVRKDSDFAHQVPDNPRSDELYRIIESAASGERALSYFRQPYGYPRRLMVPRGKPGGLVLRLLAIVTPLEQLAEVDTLIAGEELDDGRALGFPLDRPAEIDLLGVKNLACEDLAVYHRRG